MFATKSQKRGAQRKLTSLKDRPFPGEDYKAGASLNKDIQQGVWRGSSGRVLAERRRVEAGDPGPRVRKPAFPSAALDGPGVTFGLCMRTRTLKESRGCKHHTWNPPVNAGDKRDAGSIPGSGRSPRGGRGNPLQYSCLENSMNRVWRATVQRVTASWTQPKRLHTQGSLAR